MATSKSKYTKVVKGFSSSKRARAKGAFGYFGAKQRLASRIVSELPPHNCWVEAFCGSAAITLAKPAAPIEVINDVDGEIVNLFKQLRNNPRTLYRGVSLTPYAREEFQKSRMKDRRLSGIERARRFLVASMMSVNGTIDRQMNGFSFSQSYSRQRKEARVSRWYNFPERLERVVERLRSVRIENRDARDLVGMFSDRPATLMYLDPPYFMKRGHGYVVDANNADFHRELLEACLSSKCMILLSAYETRLYNEILGNDERWAKIRIRTETRNTSGRSFRRTEVLWKNRQYVKAAESGRVPIRLSADERKHNKINPAR